MKTLARTCIAIGLVIILGSVANSHADGRGGFRGYGGYERHGGHGSVDVWIGPGWWGPYYRPYYYPYYQEPPIIIEQQPEVYIESAPKTEQQQVYWYYCKKPEGYYPYVKQCPDGWMKVVPTPPKPSSSSQN